MLKKLVVPFLIIILCIAGCNTKRAYEFMQSSDNITAIDLVYVDPYSSFDPDNIELLDEIGCDQWSILLEELRQIECKTHGLDPYFSLGGVNLKISYTDGGYELIGARTTLHVSAEGKLYYTPFLFDNDEFEELIHGCKTGDGFA